MKTNVCTEVLDTTVSPGAENKFKGRDFIKVFHCIKKISNYFQIEPTRRLIDLFEKKTNDTSLTDELLSHLYEKSKNFNHPEFKPA